MGGGGGYTKEIDSFTGYSLNTTNLLTSYHILQDRFHVL
jgi:hypothetical protein